MSEDTRAALVEAGISSMTRQRFQDLLSGVDTRTIVDEVGVTTGSFFHHFRNRSHFAQAVADAFVARWAVRVDNLDAAATSVLEGAGAAGLRPAAEAEWAGLVDAGDTPVFQHLLWAVRDQSLGDETARTAGDVLQKGYRHLTDSIEITYERALRLLGREMLPPFTDRDLTVITTAFAEGLQMRHGVDPDAVRDGLYTDTIAALILGVTRPRAERGDSAPGPELSALERRFLIRPHTGSPDETADDSPVETWRHIADAAAHLFVDRGPAEVRVSEVAAAAGVSASTVYHHFGTVNAVAATGWVRHLPELEALAAAPLTADEGPMRRIEEVLHRYVGLTREHRGATEALLAQVVTETGPSTDREWPRSIRAIVPLPEILLPLVRELRAAGRLRRRMETERLARSLVQLCTMQALLFPDESDERIVDETMSLVFDGAMVAPGEG